MTKDVKNMKILSAMAQMIELFDNDEALMDNMYQYDCDKCKYKDVDDNACPCVIKNAIKELANYIRLGETV